MRVLWLCNIMLPTIAKKLGYMASNKEGWLSGLIEQIREQQNKDITLGICFPVSGEELRGKEKGIFYYGFKEDTAHPEIYDRGIEERLKKILRRFKPDLVHCFGTEYPHTLAMTRAFQKPERTLIGIQGLCSVYADHFMADLPEEIQRRTVFRDWIKRDNLLRQQKKYRIRGNYEKEALENTGHVTGRTDWDRQWTEKINPKARYHFMNETLRSEFYDFKWSYESCEPCSVFMSQGNYPIKGLHYMLEAMPAILEKYPKTHLYVAGDIITAFSTWKEKIKISGYGKYIRELLDRYSLEEHVTFIGRQNGEEMRERFLKSNVFVSPSSIENSPNSVGEAMLLGVPVVSSDVGGVSNMLVSQKEGYLYPCSDISKLAECVCRVFGANGSGMQRLMSVSAREHAGRTHDPQENYRRLMEIYCEINLCV